jgi:hypothetical protein
MNRTNHTGPIVSLLLTIIIAPLLMSCKPAMPITVSFRTALLNNSLVAQFHNNSNRYLTLVVVLENKTLNQREERQIDLGPLETKEIGWAEGWKVMSGEYITVLQDDYSSLKVRAP